MYIKRTEALELLRKLSREPYYQHIDEDYYVGIAEATGEIYSMPAADVAPVVYGQWIERSDKGVISMTHPYVCNRCGRVEMEKEPYCNCGAKMK